MLSVSESCLQYSSELDFLASSPLLLPIVVSVGDDKILTSEPLIIALTNSDLLSYMSISSSISTLPKLFIISLNSLLEVSIS